MWELLRLSLPEKALVLFVNTLMKIQFLLTFLDLDEEIDPTFMPVQ